MGSDGTRVGLMGNLHDEFGLSIVKETTTYMFFERFKFNFKSFTEKREKGSLQPITVPTSVVSGLVCGSCNLSLERLHLTFHIELLSHLQLFS